MHAKKLPRPTAKAEETQLEIWLKAWKEGKKKIYISKISQLLKDGVGMSTRDKHNWFKKHNNILSSVPLSSALTSLLEVKEIIGKKRSQEVKEFFCVLGLYASFALIVCISPYMAYLNSNSTFK